MIKSKKILVKLIYRKMLYIQKHKVARNFWSRLCQRLFFKCSRKIYFSLLSKCESSNLKISWNWINRLHYFTGQWGYYKLFDIYRRNWYYNFYNQIGSLPWDPYFNKHQF